MLEIKKKCIQLKLNYNPFDLLFQGDGSVSGEDIPEDSNSLKLDYMQNEEDLHEVVVVHTNENEPNDIISEVKLWQ